LVIGIASDALMARGSQDALSLPLIIADLVSLLTILCFARIGWRKWRTTQNEGENWRFAINTNFRTAKRMLTKSSGD